MRLQNNTLIFLHVLKTPDNYSSTSNMISGVTILLSLTVFLNMVSATMPVTSDNPLLGKWSEMKAILQQLQPTNHTNTENTIHQPIAQEAKIPEIQTKLNITAHVYTLITITDVEESSWTARALLLESPSVRGRAAATSQRKVHKLFSGSVVGG